ncbi:TetR/AcrR family transcriptional regulator [Sulfitobacter donghicola]|uniref:TetR family transcriptional regulator n=1 Tax=Sulfitobacter donghicola DSW-25 = KCTC 12864 = JCM 14565 TaxID=1300350 RepID=A0A073IIC8_9RHOB|nr:TetR/AcrR family transcriptional regulator [Sulfitobacter donghicola]KEJ90068.1 TetR family transcriptional regulator [Sulfitobacter donghicola DSW-25 = KCTC 12864 = JCM 14565]KIN66787.1 Transcriptional regulator, TetR family protein [Sulfitobacter donghicola DSW-25 = KCTC 12864 = JCM 14565]
MREETKKLRHEAIAIAAYALLEEKGYDGASMLSIAKAAKASNETLYRWYGDKQGLFTALVRDNAALTAQTLDDAVTEGADPRETLRNVAPVFLKMLLSDRAVLLNRAAAAEPTGELGKALSLGGREAVFPRFQALMQRLVSCDAEQAGQLTGTFLGLLVGDLQMRRVIGVQPVLNDAQIAARCDLALQQFAKIIA